MENITRRQAMTGGALALVASGPATAISTLAMPPDTRLAAAIGNFHEIEQRMLAATNLSDEAWIALGKKLDPPPWSIRKYMIQSDGDGIYRWQQRPLELLRSRALLSMALPPDNPRRIFYYDLLSDNEAYQRQCAGAVSLGDVAHLKAAEEKSYRAMTAALEEAIALPFRGLGGAIQKLQLADELGDLSESEGRPPEAVEERSDHARLFISAMDELTRLSAEG